MKTKIDYIIARVLSGEATSDDILTLSNWLNEDKENRTEFSQLKNYWDAEVSFNNFSEPVFSLQKIQQEIEQPKPNVFRKLSWHIWGPVAAGIAILLTITSLFIYSYKGNETEHYFTYLANDHRTEFSLIDGTKIVLNRNSKLVYSDAFGKKERKVRLEGEAFFDVESNPEKPFIVSVANDEMRIKVLGTQFNVKAYPDKKNIHTTLVKGSVVLQFTDASKEKTEKKLDESFSEVVYSKISNKIINEIIMLPDEKITYNLISKETTKQKMDSAEDIGWKDGLIKYKTVAFSDLIKDLEKKFKVPIHIENKELLYSSVTVTGTFEEGQSLGQILEVVSRSLLIEWSYKEGGYYIHLKKLPMRNPS